MQGPTFQLLSKMMKVKIVPNYFHYPQRRMRAHVSIMADTKVLVKRKITVPGSFLGHSSTPAVSCSYKAASGFIYPLERGIMFVYKPPIFVKFEDVQSVNFAR